jgi:hypothetical protein
MQTKIEERKGGEKERRRGSATDANRWRSKGRRDVRRQERGRHHVREQVMIVEEMLMRLAEAAWRMPS